MKRVRMLRLDLPEMDEELWLTCSAPWVFFNHHQAGKEDDRAHRLFACAAARHAWERFEDSRARAAIELAERYAVALANEAEMATARQEGEDAVKAAQSALDAAQGELYRREEHDALHNASSARVTAHKASLRTAAATTLAARDRLVNLAFAVRCVAVQVGSEFRPESAALFGDGKRACDALRDLFGNPFRAVTFDPTWARTESALSLARVIHTTRQFDALPILADALEEAGCAEEQILRHCREPGTHVCGCWVVTGVLGGTCRP